MYSFKTSPVFSDHCWSQSVVYFSTCGDDLSHSAYLNSHGVKFGCIQWSLSRTLRSIIFSMVCYLVVCMASFLARLIFGYTVDPMVETMFGSSLLLCGYTV